MTMFERFGRNARVAVVLAQEEARELSSDAIDPEHLLVGVVQSAGHGLSAVLGECGLTTEALRIRLMADAEEADPEPDAEFDADAEALRHIGIDLRAVRDNIAHTFGADAFDSAVRRSGRRRRRRGHIPFAK